ncbi:alpha/beta fold hydrolase [Luteimonas sp. MC1825]|uniref:alpha/beta hydrolase family protein n=1 Tax=Luteimonas sp. MC1825 TaxID=2761107 RepID=UPI001CC5382A|nr:alpha/beta fold hydrolase [Luteimonas sp. MC1825]
MIAVRAGDDHRYELLARIPAQPRRSLLWLPALGIAARHYLPFADALAERGTAVFIHEWRGHGSSSLRAGRAVDWGYRELLEHDIPASEAAIDAALPGLARVAGGHSLGGQLACCRLALAPDAATTLWLVGSGAPWWRAFRLRERMWLPMAYRFLPWLADRAGALPGRSIGFGGNEARGLLRDWSATAISGRYAVRGLGDLEPRMATLDIPVRATLLERDWLAPASSLHHLLSRLPRSQARVTTLSTAQLGVPADHYAWMKSPHAVADSLGS